MDFREPECDSLKSTSTIYSQKSKKRVRSCAKKLRINILLPNVFMKYKLQIQILMMLG